jgi:hypothetical protein
MYSMRFDISARGRIADEKLGLLYRPLNGETYIMDPVAPRFRAHRSPCLSKDKGRCSHASFSGGPGRSDLISEKRAAVA